MNIVGLLSITLKRNQYIIVVVKYLSKWQEIKAVGESNALSISDFLY